MQTDEAKQRLDDLTDILDAYKCPHNKSLEECEICGEIEGEEE